MEMRLRKIGVIVGVSLFILGTCLILGLNHYWTEYDKEHNEQGNYLPYVNLSKEDNEFRYYFGFVIPSMISFGGFFILLFSSTGYMFEEKNPTKR